MIFNRGHVNKPLRRLVKDMRNVMEPYTATNLKALKKNSLKDFVSIAGPLHVTHLLIFTETDVDGYLKVLRLPRGPTLHFKIENFSLCKDIVSSLKRSNVNQKQFLYQPLLILNGFHLKNQNEEPKMHHKLMATMFQNMFPSINVTKVIRLV
jgi:ribosome biogenesis protein SSF1/2